MINIALHAKLCSGKSLIAQLLRDHHGYNVVTLASPIYTAANMSVTYLQSDASFSLAMLDFLAALTNKRVAPLVFRKWLELLDHHEEVLLSGSKPRAFLQDFGSLVREFDENAFIRTALETSEGKCVCDDLRLLDEAWAFRDSGWALVKVDLPEAVRLDRVRRTYPEQVHLLQHRTECELDDWQDWDGVVSTDCLVEEMPDRVSRLLASLA